MLRRVALVGVAVAVVACGPSPPRGGNAPTSVDVGRGSMDVYEPSSAIGTSLVVVAVHGCCGDRRDLAGLSRALADRGVTVGNADVRAVADGGGWPVTYADAVCAFAAGRELAAGRGAEVVLLGWGDGALVATAVTLGWEHHREMASGCSADVPVDGPERVVGLGGHYGWFGAVPEAVVTAGAVDWFGATPTDDPIAWTHGNPGWWVEREARLGDVAFTLIAGADDATGEFAAEVLRRGYAVEVRRIAGAGHGDMVQPRGVPGQKMLDALVDALQAPTAGAPSSR